MDWQEILITALGCLGGTGGIVTLYMARAKRNSLEIDNFRKLFDEAQQERDNIRSTHEAYRRHTDGKIAGLENKIDTMYRRQNILQRAINAAWGCRHTDTHRDCPVIKTLTEEEEKQ